MKTTISKKLLAFIAIGVVMFSAIFSLSSCEKTATDPSQQLLSSNQLETGLEGAPLKGMPVVTGKPKIIECLEDEEFDGLSERNIPEKALPVTTTAVIKYGGDPKVDGFGWFFQLNKSEWEVPTCLPVQFQITDLRVKVTYSQTQVRVPVRGRVPKYKVKIISITKL